MLDAAGLVTGVVTAKINTPKLYSRTGKLIQNVGLAIDGATARRFLDRYGVAYRSTSDGEPMPDAAILKRAQGFIARVLCEG